MIPDAVAQVALAGSAAEPVRLPGPRIAELILQRECDGASPGLGWQRQSAGMGAARQLTEDTWCQTGTCQTPDRFAILPPCP